MTDKEIISLFEKSLNKKAAEIKDCSNGIEQVVKIITSQDKKYIIKFPKEQVMNSREIFACQKIKDLSDKTSIQEDKIPVPEIIFKGYDFIIETHLEGESLDTLTLTPEQEKNIYTQLGQYLAKIHTIKTRNFGPIDLNEEGKFPTLKEMGNQNLKNNLNYIESNNILTKEESFRLKTYIKNNNQPLNSNESVLLHFDYDDYNILAKDDQITGIIDFGDLSAGPRLWDLARLHITHYNTDKLKYITNGYGEINQEEIKFFMIITAISIIKHNHANKNEAGLEKTLNVLKEIINK